MKSIRSVLFFVTVASVVFLSSCATQTCVEKPVADCICTLQYDPVCGCNNKTYGNACEAECAGIKKYTKGPCEKS